MKLKKDKFRKSRGDYSRWLLISCEKCKEQLMIYQKDGPGILKRLYLDRIVKGFFANQKNIVCNNCKTLIGIPIIYKKEKRKAYRLFAGAVEKKVMREEKVSRII